LAVLRYNSEIIRLSAAKPLFGGILMLIEVEATYENGVLKLDKPLPLRENERVTVQVTPHISISRRRHGSIQWTGDPEVLRMIAEDPEFGIHEAFRESP
jgi:predicted DNA-binding antitoxin AbrB/MazE fold protein